MNPAVFHNVKNPISGKDPVVSSSEEEYTSLSEVNVGPIPNIGKGEDPRAVQDPGLCEGPGCAGFAATNT